jgi:hypothetical protein
VTCTNLSEGVAKMRISRTTGAFSGFLLVILGIWGGIVPFIGPSFGYAFGTHATWYYTANRLYLDILPGVAVVAGGLILLRAGNRASGVLGSWLAIAGGAWFVIGPAMSRTWEHTLGPIGAPMFGKARQTLELLGTFYGLGALIIALAAFALGRVVSRPALVVAEPAAAQPVAAEPVTAEPASSEDEDHSIPAVDAPYEPVDESAEREHVTTGSVTGAL